MYIRYLFQHTAARRRLENITEWIDSCRSFNTQPPEGGWAAAARHPIQAASFNTQPPEGGWLDWLRDWLARMLFQHTAARRRLVFGRGSNRVPNGFNTQPPEGGWGLHLPIP